MPTLKMVFGGNRTQDLPRLVWELGDTNPEASLRALRTIHSAACFCPAEGPLASSLDHIQPQVAALFVAVVPADAAQRAKPNKARPLGPKRDIRRKNVQGQRLESAPSGQPAAEETGGARQAAPNGILPGGKALVAGPLSRLPLHCQVSV